MLLLTTSAGAVGRRSLNSGAPRIPSLSSQPPPAGCYCRHVMWVVLRSTSSLREMRVTELKSGLFHNNLNEGKIPLILRLYAESGENIYS